MPKPAQSYNLYRWVFTVLILSMLCASLVQSDMFILPLLSSYYLIIALVTLFIFFTGVVVLIKKRIVQPPETPIPVLFFICWALYILVHGKFVGGGFNQRHIFLLTSCCLFLAVFISTTVRLVSVRKIYLAIMSVAFFEAIVCILQFAGVWHSHSDYFNVTGSWENPNVTAMFLALSVPAIYPVLSGTNPTLKKVSIGILLSIGFALLSLKCRTAYVGVTAGTACLFYFRYNWAAKIKEGRNRGSLIVAILAVAVVAAFLGNHLYQEKKNSADGRKLVWKLSGVMFLDRPITGYGYGLFEKNYNLYQSKYITEGNASLEELENAGFVRMGYNEYLENAVDGGGVGLLLFSGLILSPLLLLDTTKKSFKDNPFAQVAYAAIATFATMSLVNFSASAMVVMLVFVVYSATLCGMMVKDFRSPAWLKATSRYSTVFIPALLLASAFGLVLSQYQLPFGSHRNSQAISLGKEKQYDQAIKIFKSIHTNIPDNEVYLTNYGATLLMAGRSNEALVVLDEAKRYTSNPDLFRLSGECYFKLQKYVASEREFAMAAALQPQTLSPRVSLMNVYYLTRDTVRAAEMAYGILKMQPRKPSAQTDKYKLSARNILIKLNRPIDILQPKIDFKGVSNQASFN